ncbi:hypothetical protein JOF48_000554 [Arthrobacter stackebrandtii]|uniref:Protein NO VEIN C-terminal domain-containing protein n=1 Tax=Arthrobacter stackebrandtii TaxID=272161 RepID=A0ABS4YTH5_9MICC|nr:DUF3883 domain-containing protein [Arthrobacter stackebrandtii]MBP2411755.1 hypothetical protein [Arthrobacter stackebrandtii]PYG99148.1 hypothetical protein CVV67_16470 [Arthrobacter stackebrandtii]
MAVGVVEGPWTDDENALTVSTYFGMLRTELSGERLNKAQFNRGLQESTGRSRGAIEFKLANISAVLHQMKAFYINGYKPRSNVQSSLRAEVERQLRADSALESLMFRAVDVPVVNPAVDLVLQRTAAPTLEVEDFTYHRRAIKTDFVRLESNKRDLGIAGELAVVNHEKHRLVLNGCSSLADRVEHVSVTQGDGLGFDVLSFNADGSERFIEVKTTRRADTWPFIATRNEVAFSTEIPEQFHLYRVYGYGGRRPGLFTLPGSLEDTCALVPRDFDAYAK